MAEDFEINITPNGVSVRQMRTRTLKDEATGEVIEMPLGNHRQAIGIGDFKSADDFHARVAELCAPVLGNDLAQMTAIAAKATSERDDAIIALGMANAAASVDKNAEQI